MSNSNVDAEEVSNSAVDTECLVEAKTSNSAVDTACLVEDKIHSQFCLVQDRISYPAVFDCVASFIDSLGIIINW